MPRGHYQSVPERLPSVPYEGHPLYSEGKARLGQRLFALVRFVEWAYYVAIVRLWQLINRRWMRPEGISNELEVNGVLPVRLSSGARDELRAASQKYFQQLRRTRDPISPSARTYGDNQLDLKISDAPDLYSAFQSVLNQAGLLPVIRGYLRCRAEVRLIKIQINDENDTFWREHFRKRNMAIPQTVFFHVDNTYDVVKVIFYDSEVHGGNGPFSYVPGTHLIRVGWWESLILRATDIWLDVHPLERHLFTALPKCLQKKAKFGDDIADDSEWGLWLLEHERPMTSAEGDLFVFDAGGIHRGGMVTTGERRIIQLLIR